MQRIILNLKRRWISGGSEMVGKYRRAIFAVAYSKTDKIEYLLLHRVFHWRGWEFPKGGLKAREKLIDAVKREVKEETGLKILSIKNMNFSGKYKYNKELPDRPGISGQEYNLFAVEVKKAGVKFDKHEHEGYKWLSFTDAVKKVTHKNQKKCLEVVDKIISR